MASEKPGDRRVIWHHVHGDHPIGDIVSTVPLDPPSRPLVRRIGVEHQRNHHRRLIRRATMPIGAIGVIERRQLQRLHAIQQEPRKVIPRQPVPQRRRQQQLLIPITRQEVLRHAVIVLNPPDNNPFARQPRVKAAAWAFADLAKCEYAPPCRRRGHIAPLQPVEQTKSQQQTVRTGQCRLTRRSGQAPLIWRL
jgi:hypothetical protein